MSYSSTTASKAPLKRIYALSQWDEACCRSARSFAAISNPPTPNISTKRISDSEVSTNVLEPDLITSRSCHISHPLDTAVVVLFKHLQIPDQQSRAREH